MSSIVSLTNQLPKIHLVVAQRLRLMGDELGAERVALMNDRDVQELANTLGEIEQTSLSRQHEADSIEAKEQQKTENLSIDMITQAKTKEEITADLASDVQTMERTLDAIDMGISQSKEHNIGEELLDSMEM